MSSNEPLLCYRVWFKDGSALLVDALSTYDAGERGIELARKQNPDLDVDEALAVRVESIECLD